jgi:phage-related protein (TIGR01555 family)
MGLEDFRKTQQFAVDAQRVRSRSTVAEGTKTEVDNLIGVMAMHKAMDAFQNQAARVGFGTTNLLEGTQYPLTRLTWNYILMQSLYRNNWIARKLIDAVAEDMTKNWVSFNTESEPKKVKKLEQAVTFTGTQDKVLSGLKWARLFGGAGGVIIVKGQKLDTPLVVDDVPIDSFRGVIAFDRWSGIMPSAKISTDLDRPLDYGLPETYRITTENAGGFEVHASRVMRFVGRSLPQWEFQAEQRWGVSEIEIVYEELKKRDNTSYNLASLIFRANIFELRQKDLVQLMSGLGTSPQAQQRFYSSLSAQMQLMSNQGMIVSDSDSGGLSTHQYGFSGIADVYVQFMLDICGACEIPFSRLFGRGASGLGQTGEGDEHAYYSTIGQKQKRELDPQMMKLMPVVCMSTLGKIPDDFEWKWKPVNSPTDQEQSELASKTTTAVVEATNAGIICPQTALKELKQLSNITGLFSNITDEEIEAASTSPINGDMPGLGGEGGEEGNPLTSMPSRAEKGLKLPEDNPKEKQAQKKESAKGKEKGDDKAEKKSKETTAAKKSTGTKKAKDARPALEHLEYAGFPVVIENPIGSQRSGPGWSVIMTYPYGYVEHTMGVDGDAVDCFLGPEENSRKVYIIHTKNPHTGKYDEDKTFIGFPDADAAIEAFYQNYSNRAILQGIEMIPVNDFRKRLVEYRGRKLPAYDAEWVETDHPRVGSGPEGGQFTSGSGGAAAATAPAKANQGGEVEQTPEGQPNLNASEN